MGFKTEQELFDTAFRSIYVQDLLKSYSQSIYLVEPRGLFGIPDLVIAGLSSSDKEAISLRTFAFEMKLSNWTRALVQAFRYRAFATMSYVVLDHRYISRALQNIQRFITANIGLLSIDTLANVTLHHQPFPDIPYSQQLEATFQKMIQKQGLSINIG